VSLRRKSSRPASDGAKGRFVFLGAGTGAREAGIAWRKMRTDPSSTLGATLGGR
jgi:hypothetical protein